MDANIMNVMDWVAIIGAAAWTPQIITWICKLATRPKISAYLHSRPEIGYTSLGPIFNIQLALISENKDAILNKFSVNLKHENGASYVFDWDGISEDLSQIENPGSLPMSVRKVSLPLVVKVLHTGVAQAFVRYQYQVYKAMHNTILKQALDCFNLLKSSGKLKNEEDIHGLEGNKEFAQLLSFYNSEFIWMAGKYTVVFSFKSPNKIKYKRDEYTFSLNQEDIENLRKNIGNIKFDLTQRAKSEIMADFKSEEISWNWIYPELKK